MNLFGTIVNAIAIIAGATVGILLNAGVVKRYNEIVMQAISLAVILVGISMALKTDALLIVILSLAIGSILGEFIRIEEGLERLGKWIEARVSTKNGQVAKGFVLASLVYCVGSMAIVGALESGLTGEHQTLFAKSILDGVTAVIFAASFGIGVMFAAIPVVCYQGTITLLASLLKPFLTQAVIDQMASVGGLLIFGIGINLLEIKRIKVGNMLPAIFLPLAWFIVYSYAG